jgi:hypothetical protein
MKKTTLMFPDPNVSFHFYLRREEALRKHAAQKGQQSKLKPVTTPADPDSTRTQDAATARIDEIRKLDTTGG